MASEIQLAMTPIEEDEEKADDVSITSETQPSISSDQPFDTLNQNEYDTDLEMEKEADEFDVTGRQLYITACKHLAIVPVSYFLQHMQEPTLVMKYHGLGPLGIKAVALALQINTQVLSLDIEGNWIEGIGGKYIANMLKDNIYITELNLADNNLGSKGAAPICEMLAVNTTLQILNLSGNNFTDSDAVYFVEALTENRRVQFLNLSHNRFGEKGAFFLGPAIAENETLEDLDLSWNCLRKRGAIEICDSIKNNARLKKVNLAFNGLGKEGGRAVADIIKSNSIILELDVSHNRIPAEAASFISKSLEGNDALKVFRITHNPLGPGGAMDLLKGIASDSSVLEVLDMSGIEVDKAFIAAKTEFLETRKNIEIFHSHTLEDYVIKGPPKSKLRILLNTPLVEIEPSSVLNTINEHCIEKRIRIKLKERLLTIDKNNDNKLSVAEFISAMQWAEICLSAGDVSNLTAILKTINATEIDFSIFLKD
ncbi:hypothetical protein SNE40_014514 [Patella caerulea]|uniref:EF-hand domain-containing protein n=1 Tax=Patella caerulea TaxID=87958 RepID=A0AAN8JH25_PATCE